MLSRTLIKGFAVLSACALAGCGGGYSATSAPPAPTSPVYGLDFSPYVNPGQDPNFGTVISSSQITSLLNGLKGYTQWIRTFGTQNGLENVPAIAHQMGFKTIIGAFIGSDATVNNGQIANLVTAANAGNVDIAVVGNEVLLTNSQSESQVLAYIQSVKAQVPANVKVTYVDTWNTIVAHPNIIAAVDVVAVNIYPFYENQSIDQALATFQADYAQTVQAAGGKPVIIAETGWPSAGNPPSFSMAAVPSLANAAQFFTSVEAWARSNGNPPLFYFEGYDEPWKANHNDYSSWGIWDYRGNLKPGFGSVFQQ